MITRLLFFTCASLLYADSLIATGDIFNLGEEYFLPPIKTNLPPPTAIRDIEQDQDGFIWLGSESGLYRFDGYQYKQYKSNPTDQTALAEDFIYKLFSAEDGRTWISSASFLNVYNPKTNLFKRYQHDPSDIHSLGNNEIIRIKHALGRGLWLMTFDGLDFYDYKTERFSHYKHIKGDPKSLIGPRAYDRLQLEDGRTLVATSAGLSFMLADGSFEAFPFAKSITNPSKNITARSLYRDSFGNIWIGTTSSGLYKLSPDGDVTHIEGTEGKFPAIGTAFIIQVTSFDDKELWAAGYETGLFVIDIATGKVMRKLHSRPQYDRSISSNRISKFMLDRSGILWLSQGSGRRAMNRYNTNSPASRLIYGGKIPSKDIDVAEITTIEEDKQGRIWVAGYGLNILSPDNGRLDLWSDALKKINKISTSLNTIRSLFFDDNNQVWVTFYDIGVKVFDIDGDVVFEFNQDDSNCTSTKISVLSKSEFWTTCEVNPRAIRINLETKAIGIFPLVRDESLKFSRVNTAVAESNGNIWVGGEHGLHTKRYQHPADADNTTEPSFYSIPQLHGQFVSQLLVSMENDLWISSSEGLYIKRSNSTEITKLPSNETWPASNLFGDLMIEDHLGNVWGKYGFLNKDSLVFTPVTAGDGIELSRISSNASTRTKHNTLLLASDDGMLMIKPERFKAWTYSPKVLATDIRIDGQPIDASYTKQITLSSSNERLTIEPVSLDYSAPSRNQYQHRLVGLNDRWQTSDAANKRIEYDRLAPGEYELQIKGSNRLGNYNSQIHRMTIVVQPKWFQTLAAQLLFTAALLATLYAIYYLRLASLKRNRKQLIALVDERTVALNHRNVELEQKSDQLSEAMNQLVETQNALLKKEKMISLSKLISGVAHEVNTPIGVGVTAASHLNDITLTTSKSFSNGTLDQGLLKKYFMDATKSASLLLGNLTRSAKLINSFKEISVDEHEQVIHTIKLVDLVSAAIEEASITLPLDDQQLHVQIPSTIEITTYPQLLTKIIVSLINNSLMHGLTNHSDGIINIHAERVINQTGARPKVQDGKDSNNSIKLIFWDNGKGILPEHLPQIFDPFFKAQSNSINAGLGLSIIYNLITYKLDGGIECTSTHGEYCQFTIELPISVDVASSGGQNL